MQHMSLFLASLGFLLIHFVSATNIRATVVAKMGQNAWMMLYSALELGFFVWMVIAYMRAIPTELIWVLPNWWLWVNALLIFVALAFIIMGNIPDKQARLGKGIFAITRHPSNWGMAIFSIAHLISNGSIEAVYLWGSVAGTGIIGSYFLDKRKIKTGEKRWKEAPLNSSWLPFWAVITGKTKLRFEDFKPAPVMVSVAVFFVAAIVHVAVFGTHILPL